MSTIACSECGKASKMPKDRKKENGDNRFFIEIRNKAMMGDAEWARLLMLLNLSFDTSEEYGDVGAFLCDIEEVKK